MIHTLRTLPNRVPLRVTLVSSMLLLVTVALGASGAAGTYMLRRYLVDGVDERTGGEAKGARITFADIELDADTHEVWKAGRPVALSPTEFKLLRYLMENAGRVLSKAQILDHVWRYDFGGDGGVVESYVSYLRKKVDTTEPRLIHTLRGVGYTMRQPRR